METAALSAQSMSPGDIQRKHASTRAHDRLSLVQGFEETPIHCAPPQETPNFLGRVKLKIGVPASAPSHAPLDKWPFAPSGAAALPRARRVEPILDGVR